MTAASEGTFEGAGGLRIAYRRWSRASPRAPRATVVIAHTLYDHAGRYDEFARNLVRSGIDVWALDMRGHGYSDGQRGVVDSFDAAADDLGQLIDLVKRSDYGGRLFVVAHSVGAVTALRYAIDHQHELSGLVITAPVLDFHRAPAPVQAVIDRLFRSRLVARVSTRIRGFTLDPAQMTSDPGQLEIFVNDPLVLHEAVPLRTAAEMSKTIRGPIQARQSEITLPVLIVHGQDDAIVVPQTAVELRNSLSSSDLTLELMPGMRHDLFHESTLLRRRFNDLILDWVDARVAPPVIG